MNQVHDSHLIDLTWWTFIVYGTTYILVFGNVFAWLRNGLHESYTGINNLPAWVRVITGHLHKMIGCPLCTSFWVGMFYALCHIGPVENIFLAGVAASGVTQLIVNTTHQRQNNQLQIMQDLQRQQAEMQSQQQQLQHMQHNFGQQMHNQMMFLQQQAAESPIEN